MNNKQIPVSIGEYIDKITILKIKVLQIKNSDKLNNVKKELDLLLTLDEEGIVGTEEYYSLYRVNQMLWEVEDAIRIKERDHTFDDTFVKLARDVYLLNDERSRIKKQINLLYKSDLIEEKSYE